MADVDATSKAPVDRLRPLSPHLGIYRLTVTMAMSILHRITGATLYVGTMLLVWWLVALSTDASSFTHVSKVLRSIPGQVVMFGYTWVLFHHMMGGIRHLIWDTGHALDYPAHDRLSQATIIASTSLTLIVWVAVYMIR